MERPFEKYSLLLLVTIRAITNKRNKRERNSYKWSLHQSAVATPRSSSVLKTYIIVSVKTTMIHPITTLICMTFLRAAFSDFSLKKFHIKKSILSSSLSRQSKRVFYHHHHFLVYFIKIFYKDKSKKSRELIDINSSSQLALVKHFNM